jgi:hypothetical protein
MVWIGQKLKDLRRHRNIADYQLHEICTAKLSGSVLKGARGVFEKLGIAVTDASA